MSAKKAAKANEDNTTYDLRDIVLAKVRGFPPWPAMVSDPNSVPKTVKKERPQGKKQVFYCVRFFPAGDYAWVLPKDLSKLKTHEIESYIAEPHKRNGDLLSGYRIALDPEKWEKEMEEKAMQASETDNEAENDEEVDQLDGEEEADEDKPKGKKRKRDADASAKPKTKAKKEKNAGEMKKKKPTEKGEKAKNKKNGAKSKTVVESEDEADHGDHVGSSKKASPPPSKKAKRDKDEDGDANLENDEEAKKVRDWRHKLQKAFLGKSMPKDADMPFYDGLFNQVEEFTMNIRYLQFSKIGKVMRHLAALESQKVPRDDEFKFRDRAQALVNKWQTTIVTKQNGVHESAKGSEDDKTVPPVSAPPASSGAPTIEKTEEKTEETAVNGDIPVSSSVDVDMANGVEAPAPAVDTVMTEPAEVTA